MGVGFEIFGAEKALKFLENVNKEVEKAKTESMAKVGLFMEGQVKSSISGHEAEQNSVDTGRFLNSVKEEHDESSATIKSEVDYAQYLEYGTTSIDERRHFRNSLDRNREKIKDFVQAEIDAEIKG